MGDNFMAWNLMLPGIQLGTERCHLIASGAALKVLTEGAKYVKDSVKKIIDEKTDTEEMTQG